MRVPVPTPPHGQLCAHPSLVQGPPSAPTHLHWLYINDLDLPQALLWRVEAVSCRDLGMRGTTVYQMSTAWATIYTHDLPKS